MLLHVLARACVSLRLANTCSCNSLFQCCSCCCSSNSCCCWCTGKLELGSSLALKGAPLFHTESGYCEFIVLFPSHKRYCAAGVQVDWLKGACFLITAPGCTLNSIYKDLAFTKNGCAGVAQADWLKGARFIITAMQKSGGEATAFLDLLLILSHQLTCASAWLVDKEA